VSLRISGNLNFPEERSCDTISIGTAKSSGREHYTENLWSMQTMGASTDTFFIVTCSGYLCRGVLYKYKLCPMLSAKKEEDIHEK
jgi:hypothetical protein